MNIQVVEAFWRSEEHGEYSARYSAKPFWAGFGDAWCWENDATPIGITLATVDEKDALIEQFKQFREKADPGIMILGAHGRDPERGHRHMLLRDNKGKVVPLGWEDLISMLETAGSAALHDKVLVLDSCSFCANGRAARRFVRMTRIGLLCGYKRDITPIDSMVFELAFVNYLLWEWYRGDRSFQPDFLQRRSHPCGADFVGMYKGLARELGFRMWRWNGDQVEEITASGFGKTADRISRRGSRR